MSLILNYTVYLFGTFIKTCIILTTPYIVGILILATIRNCSLYNSTGHILSDDKKIVLAETDTTCKDNDSDDSLVIGSSGTTNATPGQLDTVYELRESPTEATFDEIWAVDTLDKDTMNATLPSPTLTKAPSPQPSLSSPPSMESRRRTNTQSFNYTYSTRTPPLTMTPSLSTSTVDSLQAQSPILSPSSSLQRRNSRVGQLVLQFEMGHLENSRSTPIKIEGASKVSDTIASLYKVKENTKPRTYRPANIITSDLASSTVCRSPSLLSATDKTCTIDHRSVGFRPIFTTWEKRATEANSFFVPSPSQSTPVRSSTRRLSTLG